MRVRALLTVVGLVLAVPGCLDVRDFEGTWSGPILSDEMLRQGFTTSARVSSLELSNVDLNGVTASLTTNDGRFSATPLTRVSKFSSDMMASLTFDGQPVRTFLHFAPLANETASCPATVLIILFSEPRVEVRIIRGNELFGVFRLERP